MEPSVVKESEYQAMSAEPKQTHEEKIVQVTKQVRVINVEKDISAELWAVSRYRSTRTCRLVTHASWGLPLDEWPTACGWKFAKYNVKVELTKRKPQVKECSKCKGWDRLRDKVGGGVKVAQLANL